MTLTAWDGSTQPLPVTRDTDSWTNVLGPVGDLSAKICNTEFVPKDMRNSPAKVAAAILFGREQGMAPMTSLQSIHVIQGRAGMYSETMRALILREGHELRFVESTDTRCVIAGRRRGEDEWTKVSYTMAEATKSGDAKKNPNYSTRPTEMLVARATARIARMMFADVIKGMSAVEEIEYLDSPAEQQTVMPREQAEAVVVAEPRQIGRAKRTTKAPAKEKPAEQPTVERRRPKLPTPAAEPEPQPEDAEQQPDDEEQTGDEKQRSHLMRLAGMHCTRLGIDKREQRLQLARQSAGRDDINSTKDMTTDELKLFADQLEHSRDLEAMQATVSAHVEEAELVDEVEPDATPEP